jgi:putative flippase GtrA
VDAHEGWSIRRNCNNSRDSCLVGIVGLGINLAVFAAFVKEVGISSVVGAIVAFLVAVAHNYTVNRVWMFRRQRGDFFAQGLRFFVVARHSGSSSWPF